MRVIIATIFVILGVVLSPAAVSGSAADLSDESRVPMEATVRTFSNPDWVQERGVHADDFITATFVMKLDADKLRAVEAATLDRSTPGSPSYGKHMSNEDLQAAVSPPMEHVKVLLNFLAANGIQNDGKGNSVTVSRLRTTVRVRMSGTIAEKMLRTQFVQYRSVEERDSTVFRVGRGYSLPQSIARIVAFVDDIVRFPAVSAPLYTYGHADSGMTDEQLELLPQVNAKASAVTDPYLACSNRCYGFSTPAVLQRQYGYDAPPLPRVAESGAGSGLGVASFQHRRYNPADVDAFTDMCHVHEALDGKVSMDGRKSHRGGHCSMGACLETTMAVQYAKAITSPLPLTLFYGEDYSLLHWLSYLLDATGAKAAASGDGDNAADNGQPLPLVQVAGQLHADNDQVSPEFAHYANAHCMLAAAKGYSLLVAAGDSGVWGRGGVIGRDFNPDLVGSAPWVTSVGGTNIHPHDDSATTYGVRSESVWECSGGGFSDHFPMPEWQRSTVRSYLVAATADASLPPSRLFNATGRAFPDLVAVAGEANPFCVVFDDAAATIGVSSTMAAATVVASVVAQLNNERLLSGRPALGFLNPLLYSDAFPRSCYQDVTDRSKNNCHRGTAGFAAGRGWDAASGWGSINAHCLATNLAQAQ